MEFPTNYNLAVLKQGIRTGCFTNVFFCFVAESLVMVTELKFPAIVSKLRLSQKVVGVEKWLPHGLVFLFSHE